MNSRNWVKFFLHTLFIGGFITVITGFIAQWDQYQPLFMKLDLLEIGSISLWLLGVGFIFSVISQMGYFAYLTVNRFGLGFFRSLWNPVQIVIIAFVLFDLIYFRYKEFASEADSVLPYIGVAFFLFAIGTLVAYIKAKQSNKHAFVPGLFFMVCVTIIEWVPVLRVNEQDWVQLMIYPLIACNAYQLLSLPNYIKRSTEEKIRLQKQKQVIVK